VKEGRIMGESQEKLVFNRQLIADDAIALAECQISMEAWHDEGQHDAAKSNAIMRDFHFQRLVERVRNRPETEADDG
jgi:hypothetical protein